MHRRDLLRAAASAATLAILPGEAWADDAHHIWERVRLAESCTKLEVDASATIAALADAIIPRTDSPSATDVGVPAFIAVIAAEYYSDEERTALLTGVEAIDALARSMTGQPFESLRSADLVRVMDALDVPADRTSPAARGYSRLKTLVVHGYFTSERVQRDVLKTDVMPGRFDGDAPMAARRVGPGRE